jgi:cell division protein FtsB
MRDTPARPDAGTTLEPLSWTDARKLVLDSIHRAAGHEAEQREADALGAYIADLSKQAAERERLEAQVEEMAEQMYDSIPKWEARNMVERLEAENARLRAALEDLAQPCTRADYTVAKLDAVVMEIARRALTSAGEGCSTCGGVREIDTGGRGEMASRIVPCPDCEGEEPNTATDYYHAEMQRLSGEGEPSDG